MGVKSKSFASPGQFECSVEDSAGRKMQMLSFFFSNNNNNNNGNNMKKKESRGQRRTSVAELNDDIEMGEDDLVDIDAEFESLLTKTFEKESRKMSGGEKVNNSASSQVISKRSSGGVGGRGVSLDMTGRGMSLEMGHHPRLQKSQ